MNTGIVKSKASAIALMGKVLVGVMVVGMPQQVLAVSNTQFSQYIYDICTALPLPTGWDATGMDQMCQGAWPGGYAGGPSGATNVTGNLGTANAVGGIASRKKMRIEEQEEQPVKGASADSGGWGLLLAPQYSKSNRMESDLENGYQANLVGLGIGLDYRYSDGFVLGGIIGQTKDKVTFLNNAGSLKTSNNTITLYGTWLPTNQVSVDGYLGFGKINLDGQRHVSFGNIDGMTYGSTTGSQRMAGLSTSYQTEVGRFNFSPFLNLDYIKTNFRGYTETGDTVMVLGLDAFGNPGLINIGSSRLALRYFERSTTSFTSSLGGRMGTSYGYDWGALETSVRLAAVHEFQNKAQQLRNELIITPGFGMSVATDAPDRNYLLSGLGVVAALNGGAQLFFDFERRSQDRFLSSWSISLGGLVEF